MKHLLAEMTFLEFRERMADDPVILLPLGSQEIQGPCNPMGDAMLASALAARVAERTGAIAAPTLPFGYAYSFRPVPGGIQLSPDTFKGVLRDMMCAFLDHGLQRILVFNGHTGNNALIDLTLREIKRDRGAIVPWLNIWPMVPASLRRQAHGDNATRASGHGCDPIGSVYEYLFPQLTRREQATNEGTGKLFMGLPSSGLSTVQLGDVAVNVPIDITDHCDYVTDGDPSLANPEAGKLFADYIVDTAATLVGHLAKLPKSALTAK
jgi:creatinine amidohydrolase